LKKNLDTLSRELQIKIAVIDEMDKIIVEKDEVINHLNLSVKATQLQEVVFKAYTPRS